MLYQLSYASPNSLPLSIMELLPVSPAADAQQCSRRVRHRGNFSIAMTLRQ
jgi:hypothetical protein